MAVCGGTRPLISKVPGTHVERHDCSFPTPRSRGEVPTVWQQTRECADSGRRRVARARVCMRLYRQPRRRSALLHFLVNVVVFFHVTIDYKHNRTHEVGIENINSWPVTARKPWNPTNSWLEGLGDGNVRFLEAFGGKVWKGRRVEGRRGTARPGLRRRWAAVPVLAGGVLHMWKGLVSTSLCTGGFVDGVCDLIAGWL